MLSSAPAVFLVRDHTREDSLSADEPIHILSGYFAVASRSAIVNIEHPPLMKALSGLALRRCRCPPAREVAHGEPSSSSYGPDFFYREPRPARPDLAAAARAPFLVVLAALLLLVFFAARARYGPAAGALRGRRSCAFDPNFLAHAGVVHTDLGAALAFSATVLAWDAARRSGPAPRGSASRPSASASRSRRSSRRSTSCRSSSSRRSSPRGATPAPGPRVRRGRRRLAAVGAGALLVVIAVYCRRHLAHGPRRSATVIREMVGDRGPGARAGRERIAALGRVSRPLAHYVGGLARSSGRTRWAAA